MKWLAKVVAAHLVTVNGVVFVGSLIIVPAVLDAAFSISAVKDAVGSGLEFMISQVSGRGNYTFLLFPIIVIAVTYRLPKTSIFLASVALATMYLTPLHEEVRPNLGLLTASAVAVLVLASIISIWKLRRRPILVPQKW